MFFSTFCGQIFVYFQACRPLARQAEILKTEIGNMKIEDIDLCNLVLLGITSGILGELFDELFWQSFLTDFFEWFFWYFFMKFLWFGPWVSRIDWCEEHWCDSTYMVMRLSNISSKTVFLGCFWAYVGQPHDHISWAIPMPFSSINSTSPRTNPWKFHEKILRIGGAGKWGFFEAAILNFLSWPFWIFFCFISVKNPAHLYEVSFFSALWMVFPESWKRRGADFYAHDCKEFWSTKYFFFRDKKEPWKLSFRPFFKAQHIFELTI